MTGLLLKHRVRSYTRGTPMFPMHGHISSIDFFHQYFNNTLIFEPIGADCYIKSELQFRMEG
jgi:hypothetical protein